MLDFLTKFFGWESPNASKSVAKERLRLVLVHDRSNISPQVMEALRKDLIRVISDYMEIDESAIDVNLNNEDNTVALVANIPVIRMKRNIDNQHVI